MISNFNGNGMMAYNNHPISFFNPISKHLNYTNNIQTENNQHQQNLDEFNYYINNNRDNNNVDGTNRQLLNNKPPEIVITESKSENDLIDYGDQVDRSNNSQQNNYLNCFKFAANIENNIFNSNKSAKKESDSGYGGNFMLSEALMNRNKLSVLEKKFSKSPEPNMGSSIFEDWKNMNSKIDNFGRNKDFSGNVSPVGGGGKGTKLIKPHVCTNCQKRFARSDMLIRHSRLHSGVRPYRCNRCGQEFSRSDHLNTHLRTHTGEKPYSCPHPKCTYAACRKDMITRHLKVHNKTRISLSFDSENRPSDSSFSKMMINFPSTSFDASTISFLSGSNTNSNNSASSNQSARIDDDDFKSDQIINEHEQSKT